MRVLVVKAGSYSMKYQLFDTSDNSILAKGICESIGIDGRNEHKQPNGKKPSANSRCPNHSVAMKIVV